MSKEELFDLTQITEMLGDEEEVKRMVAIFVESTPVSLNDMNEGFKDDDAEKLARNAHKMKASLDILKINALYDDVRKIDKKHKVEDISQQELERIIKNMNSILEQVFIDLQEKYSL